MLSPSNLANAICVLDAYHIIPPVVTAEYRWPLAVDAVGRGGGAPLELATLPSTITYPSDSLEIEQD